MEMNWTGMKALFDGFTELSSEQQNTVAEYVIKSAKDGERRGGLLALTYLRMMLRDVPAGSRRQAFMDAMGRDSLTAWTPGVAQS
jgi:hypothetical protein